jgi:small subunit ribosomal protein S6
VREYETTFIVQPEISDEGSQAILDRLNGVLAAGGSTRLMCEDLGKRKLAYEIRKFHKGHYYMLFYLDEGKVVPDLERSLRMDESILRFMTVQASDRVEDIEARIAEAAEAELAQAKRAEEKAVRDIEEAKARAEAERVAAEEAAAAAAAADAGDAEAPAGEVAATASDEPADEAAAPDAPAADPAEDEEVPQS